MHNLDTNPRQNVSEVSANLALLETGLDSCSYETWCPATALEDAQLSVAATYMLGSKSMPSYWELLDGVYSGVCYYLKRSPVWYHGALSVEIHYTSDAASGDVVFDVQMSPVLDGEDFSTPISREVVATMGDTANYPHSAMLDSTSIRTDSFLDASRMGMLVTVGRVGTSSDDTNTGDVKLFGINIIYHETKRTIGVKYAR